MPEMDYYGCFDAEMNREWDAEREAGRDFQGRRGCGYWCWCWCWCCGCWRWCWCWCSGCSFR